MKSYNDAQLNKPREINNFLQSPRKNISANGKDFDAQNKEISTKKRSRKAYTKKSKKLEDELQQKNGDGNSNFEQNGMMEKT